MAKVKVKSGGFLKKLEALGNKLPHPFFMFMYISMFLVALSFIFGQLMTVTFDTPAAADVAVVNLLSAEGIFWWFDSMIGNFLGVSSIGTILMTVTTVFVAEKVGMMSYLIKKMTKRVPAKFVTPIIVFTGIMSSMASDAGYIVLVPIGALVFYAYGKHPLAGIAAAFAGVSGGFSANLLVGPIDALIAGIAVDMIPEGAPVVTTTTHWFFLIASTFALTLAGWWVTNKFVEPLLGDFNGPKPAAAESTGEITAEEKKAGKAAFYTFLVWALFIFLLSFDPLWKAFYDGFTHTDSFGSTTVYAPLGATIQYGGTTLGLMIAIVPIISLSFLVPAIAFGKSNGTLKTKGDLFGALVEGFKTTVPIMVIIFWIGQFMAVFAKTNLDKLVAVKLADGLQALNITNGVLLLVLFVLLVSFINVMISGLSTKLYLIGPVFIPALYQVGIDPEWTILAYRVADSSTNIIAPLMSYMPIIVVFAHGWMKKEQQEEFGIGSLMAIMFPYSMTFLVVSTVLMLFFYLTGIPTGF